MLYEKIYSKSHGTKHRAFALSGIYCNIKNDHTDTHRHTQVSYLALWLQAVGVQGSARRDWYLNCLWSAAAHQFRLKWGRRSSWPNPNPLLSLPVIASVCLLIAHIIFKDPDIGLPSIRSKAAAAAVWWPESVQSDTKLDRNTGESCSAPRPAFLPLSMSPWLLPREY